MEEIADKKGYTADALNSAQTLADHAGRGGNGVPKIEKEDVELAIQMRKRYEFFEAPPRDVSWQNFEDLKLMNSS